MIFAQYYQKNVVLAYGQENFVQVSVNESEREREREKERCLCYDPNLNYTEIRKYRKLPSFDGTFPFKLITVDLHLNEFNAEYQYSAKTI